MKSYQTFEISPLFTAVADIAPKETGLSDVDRKVIEALWESLLEERRGGLFNGLMLSFLGFENERLVGKFVEYKHYAAQLREPALKKVLRIEPVCVSALTFCERKLLIGKRSESVNEYPGYYELVPSGGIEPAVVEGGKVDILGQFKCELEEEAGISASKVKSIIPYVLVHDLRKERYEICAEIHLKSKHAEPLEATSEYELLFWVPLKDIPLFLKERQDSMVPFSAFLLNEFLGESSPL